MYADAPLALFIYRTYVVIGHISPICLHLYPITDQSVIYNAKFFWSDWAALLVPSRTHLKIHAGVFVSVLMMRMVVMPHFKSFQRLHRPAPFARAKLAGDRVRGGHPASSAVVNGCFLAFHSRFLRPPIYITFQTPKMVPLIWQIPPAFYTFVANAIALERRLSSRRCASAASAPPLTCNL